MSKDREFDKRKKFMMELLGDPVYQPMRFREIAGLLRLSKDEKKDLYRVLDDLIAEGKADLDSKGRYSKVTGRKRGKEKQRGKREERDEKFSGKRSGKYTEESSERRTGKKDEKHSDKKYNDKQAGKYDHRKHDDRYGRGKDKYNEDATRMMIRNSALPVWRTNIRTVHLWKAPSSVIPRALASWKSRGKTTTYLFRKIVPERLCTRIRFVL